MKLKVICDYDQMWRFLKICEDSGFYVTVDHIAIAQDKDNEIRLTGDMQVNFYSLVSSDMVGSSSSD